MNGFEHFVNARWSNHDEVKPHPVPWPYVAALGFSGECGEAMELLKKHYRDGVHPGKKLLRELGDVLNYMTVIAHSYGWTLQDVMDENVRKLYRRDMEGKCQS